MPSPFLGMDPWLENPALFPNVHQRLITYASDAIQARVGNRYFVSIGERVYIEEPEGTHGFCPDVHLVATDEPRGLATMAVEADRPEVLVLETIERREVFLEIQDATTGGTVVTVVEVLSPSNKSPGRGRERYLEKQERVLESTASLVEIDLLRAGEPTVAVSSARRARTPYCVVTSPARNRRVREIYALALGQRLPRIEVPLRAGDATVVLDLQAVLDFAYDQGAFRLKVDYAHAPFPPLRPEDDSRVSELLARGRSADQPGT